MDDLEDQGDDGVSEQRPPPIFRAERASPKGRQRLMGHYELSLDAPPATRVAAAFTELALAI
jgi:hypothetical protein